MKTNFLKKVCVAIFMFICDFCHVGDVTVPKSTYPNIHLLTTSLYCWNEIVQKKKKKYAPNFVAPTKRSHDMP